MALLIAHSVDFWLKLDNIVDLSLQSRLLLVNVTNQWLFLLEKFLYLVI